MSGERTEAPTPKKLKEARREGRIARSSDIGAWTGVLGAALVLPLVIGHGRDAMIGLIGRWPAVFADPDPASAQTMLGSGFASIASVVWPLGAVGVVVAVAAGAAQGGLHLATTSAKPQFKRLNPAKGIKRLFGVQTVWEGAKAVLKTGVLGLVLWWSVSALAPALIGAGALPLSASVQAAYGGAATLIRTAVVAGLVLAAADYFVVRKQSMKNIKMSKKEITDEHKTMEGDPQIKGQRRARQLAMSRNRMMSEIAGADVVLLNPTHVAVVLRYDPERGAPRVVAKGQGLVAARIRERAAQHRVTMVEDVALARALHSACALGQEVPTELYTAVAQVLAFVMRLRSRGAAGGRHHLPTAA